MSGNGADRLCETLLAHDIDVCFANPGTSEMHFVAALDSQPKMRCVLGVFEGVVTGAADGYARMADKPAATLLHLGPGMANALANMHNAKRADTPMVNVVGDHAVKHLPYDAPLTSDIESLARPMSHWVRRISDASDVSIATAEAIEQARKDQVTTLILPADAAWTTTPKVIRQAPVHRDTEVAESSVDYCAQLLKNGRKTLLLLGGRALRTEAAKTAQRIAKATGATVLAQGSNARIERGWGRIEIDRIPFSVDLALAKLKDFEQVVLIGAKAPVAFFAYPGKPSALLPEHTEVFPLTRRGDNLAQALIALEEAVGGPKQENDLMHSTDRIGLPESHVGFSAESIMQTVAALMPEQTIICDESVTSGRMTFGMMAGSAPHDYLQITGGAIGIGFPLAAGAAVACPDRKVVLLQADGSGMFTLQALWTHAREQLDVISIVFSNREYAILYNELRQVGVESPGENAKRMLDLDNPAFDWTAMATAAGVESAKVSTTGQFIDVFKTALKRKGPFVIEALI